MAAGGGMGISALSLCQGRLRGNGGGRYGVCPHAAPAAQSECGKYAALSQTDSASSARPTAQRRIAPSFPSGGGGAGTGGLGLVPAPSRLPGSEAA